MNFPNSYPFSQKSGFLGGMKSGISLYIQIRPPIGIKIRPFSSSKISPIKFLLSYDRPIKSIFLWKIVTSLSWFFISDLVGLKNRKYLENPNLAGP